MRYIIIYEDGTIFQTDELTYSEYDSCDDGIISIIDTVDMTDYYAGAWHEIKDWR